MPRKHRRKPSRLPQLLVLGGFVLLVMAVMSTKPKAPPVDTTSALPEAQLNLALAEKKPVLAFFHSDTCQQCILMMDAVARVYPQFEGDVALVDINVYDARNEPLMQQVRLQFIPTLIFYDHNGNSQTKVGVMQDADLKDALARLAGKD